MLAQVAVVGASLGAASQGINPEIAQLAGGALANYGYILPFSRKHESEADYVGLLLAAQAGYDPHEAVHIWERMEAAGGGQPQSFFRLIPATARASKTWKHTCLRRSRSMAKRRMLR